MEDTKEKVWNVLKQPAGLTEIKYGDVIPLIDFLAYCNEGGIINSDGFGEWATSTHSDPDTWVYPSQVKNGSAVPPKWATHVVWYNK